MILHIWIALTIYVYNQETREAKVFEGRYLDPPRTTLKIAHKVLKWLYIPTFRHSLRGAEPCLQT